MLLIVTTKLLTIIGSFLPTLSPNCPAQKLPIVIITNIRLAWKPFQKSEILYSRERIGIVIVNTDIIDPSVVQRQITQR